MCYLHILIILMINLRKTSARYSNKMCVPIKWNNNLFFLAKNKKINFSDKIYLLGRHFKIGG